MQIHLSIDIDVSIYIYLSWFLVTFISSRLFLYSVFYSDVEIGLLIGRILHYMCALTFEKIN